ncbi:MAG TPA: hypothetical protein VN048_18305 [Verrucomicrobiae bacterium]|jgi:hypothetical protein|nr:hypothetical protein [Verrucomicrobiae bacterium]
MNSGDQDFEQLRKLLKVKRYEQPPPGYFNRFSDSVINRLERDAESGRAAGFGAGWGWWGALRRVLAENPISAGIFAVCGIMMLVVGNSQYLDKYMATGQIAGLPAAPSSAATHDMAGTSAPHGGLQIASAPAVETMVSSVNPVFMNASDSLLSSLNVQPVSYTFNH